MTLYPQRQRLILALLILVFLGLISFYLRHSLSEFNVQRLQNFIAQAGPSAALVYVIFLIGAIVFPPIPNLTIISGTLFNFIPAVIYTMIGSLLGAILNFYLGRLLGRPFLQRFFKKKDLDQANRLLAHINFKVIFLLRLLPGVPFDLLSHTAGLSPVKRLTFVSATALGIFPHVLLSVALGKSLIFHPLISLVVFFSFLPILLFYHRSSAFRHKIQTWVLEQK